MKLFGDKAILTPLAELIMNEDIEGLEQKLVNGWDINQEFEVCEHIIETPINLALYYNKLKVVSFLLDHQVKLNTKKRSAITAAADSCSLETIRLLLDHGANINGTNRVGSNALYRALIHKRYDLMEELIKLGIDFKQDGTILRSAVYEKDYPAVKLLLNQGIDVNLHEGDQVHSYNPTAVHVTVENDDFEMVKLLVAHGADITIKDNYGERPYHAAKENKNQEMMDYIKEFEPIEWHLEEERINALKSYKLPKKLVGFLCGDDLTIQLQSEDIPLLRFNSIMDCKEVNWRGYKFLDLLSDVDPYIAEGFLVWYPKKNCLAHVDYEHEEMIILGKWTEFVKNPTDLIERIFNN